MGGAAANLAPDSWKGVAFDLGTLGVGAAAGTIGKVAKLAKLGKLGRLWGPMGGPVRATTFQAVQELHKAARFPEIARIAAQAQKARIGREKIFKGAETVVKATHVAHAGHMIEKSGKKLVNTLLGCNFFKAPNQMSLRPRPPLPNIASQIQVDMPKARVQSKFNKSGLSQPLPALNRIKGLPQIRDGIVPGPDIGDILGNKQMEKARKHIPLLRKHKPKVPPSFKPTANKQTAGTGITSRPFNWNSNAIPPKLSQKIFRPDRPGQPGWGLEINRSRPANPLNNMWQQGNRVNSLMQQFPQQRISAPHLRPFPSNPLRQISQGMMNPNRARPMMKPMFR